MRIGVVLLALLLVPLVSAESWTDAEGDVQLTYRPVDGSSDTDTEVPNENGWYPQFDLVETGIHSEDDETLYFSLVPAAEAPQGSEPVDLSYVEYFLHFTFHGEERRLDIQWLREFGVEPYAMLEHQEAGTWQRDRFLWSTPHPDGKGWLFPLSKWDLRDSNQAPARAGDVLEDVWARSSRHYNEFGFTDLACTGMDDAGNPEFIAQGCGMYPEDLAGSAESPLGSYEIQVSPEGLGHIILETDRPIRASNGLATTYVFDLNLHNLDADPDTVTLQAGAIPQGWDVHVPARFDLDGGERKEVRVAVSVPFGHRHGDEAGFELRATSQRDPDAPGIQYLGVFWPEIAQPSGHHSRLFLHSEGYREWMNTAPEDPQDDESGLVYGSSFSCTLCINENGDVEVDSLEAYWHVFLQPGLFTGLDFETSKAVEGTLFIELRDTVEAETTIRLMVLRADDDPILIGEQTTTESYERGSALAVPVHLPVSPEADRIPYEQYMTFMLEVVVLGDVAPQDEASALAGDISGFSGAVGDEVNTAIHTEDTYLDLPLLDYHDDVDPGLLDAFTRLRLTAPDDVARPVNPGKTVAFEFTIDNQGQSDDIVAWTVEGPMADWAQVVPSRSRVDAGDNATVAVRVDIPDDAPDREVADLLLVGQSEKDAEAQVFGRFVAYVTTEDDIPDESDRFDALQDEAAKTDARGAPAPGLALVLAGMATALLVRRRRT